VTTTKTRPRTADHLKSAKKPVQVTVAIHHDDELVVAYEEASDALARAELLQDHDADKDAAEIVQLREAKSAAAEALREATTFITFKSMGRKAYQALIEEHPPTEEQKKQYQTEHGMEAPYDQETFAPALVAACAYDSDGELIWTVEEAEEVFEEWNSSEIVTLFQAAIQCNSARRVTDLGKASGSTRSFGKS
jgi:hypothetical protein